MSLKIKSVQYDKVHLSTYQDLDVFTEELRILLSSGFSACIEVTATNISVPDWEPSKLPIVGKRKYDLGDHPSHYNSIHSTKNEATSCC
jgi:hypothetical protein